MQATNEPAQDLDQLLILADVNGVLHDIRDMQVVLAEFIVILIIALPKPCFQSRYQLIKEPNK